MRSANRSRGKPPPTRSGAACSGKKSNSPSSSPDRADPLQEEVRPGRGRVPHPPLAVFQEDADRARLRHQAQRPGLHGLLRPPHRRFPKELDVLRPGDAVGRGRRGAEMRGLGRVDTPFVLRRRRGGPPPGGWCVGYCGVVGSPPCGTSDSQYSAKRSQKALSSGFAALAADQQQA
jgi:hypothetical protein